MKKKLLFIISGIIVCFIASMILNQMALHIIEEQNSSKLYQLLLPIVMLIVGIVILTKGIRVQVEE